MGYGAGRHSCQIETLRTCLTFQAVKVSQMGLNVPDRRPVGIKAFNLALDPVNPGLAVLHQYGRALLRKAACDRVSPSLGQSYPTR